MTDGCRPAALAAVCGLLLSCSQSFGRESAIESFMAVNEDATEDEAACVVDGLIDRYGLDQLEQELGKEPLDPDFEEAQFREMFVCNVANDWQGQIEAQLVENGVPAEEAPCVSEELLATMSDDDIDVLLSGEITDSFTETFLAAVATCDASEP